MKTIATYEKTIEPNSEAETELRNLHQQLKGLPAKFEPDLIKAGDNEQAVEHLIQQMRSATSDIQNKILTILFKRDE